MMHPERAVRTGVAAAAVLLAHCLCAPDAAGLERLQRRFELERGLPFSEVPSVKQDSRGFIWIATPGGLFRYDGVELRPWPRESFRIPISSVFTGPAGEVLVRDYVGWLYEVDGDTLKPFEGPEGSPLLVQAWPIWDTQERLWIRSEDRLWFRSRGWNEFPLSELDDEEIYLLDVSADGSPILVTDKGIWRIDGALGIVRLASIGRVEKAIVRPDGSIAALLKSGRVVELRDGTERELDRSRGRPIDIVQRGATLWVSYDAGLSILAPGEPPEFLGLSDDVPSGGPLLVDREGSLWMGTFRGLVQYPAPETVAFNVADGMPINSVRRLEITREGIWVDSWGGLTLLRREGESWRPEPVAATGTSGLCVGTDGSMWAGYTGRFLQRQDGRFIEHPRPDLSFVRSCAAGAEGRVWLSSDIGVFVAGADLGAEAPPKMVASPPGALEGGRDIFEDSGGRLWVAAGEVICQAEAGEVASGQPASWNCTRIEDSGAITGLAEPSPGQLWAATLQAGAYRFAGGERWERVLISRELPTRMIRKLRPSPSGGVWVVSFGMILRLVDRPDSAEGWEIAERLAPWHGLMISDAEDILEEESGDLWITTLAGLVHIPPEVRRAERGAPRVELVDVLVDGEPTSWRDGLALPYRRNRIELRFAALSYRDPGLIRYQVRLRPDAPWQEASDRPTFQFVDVTPGRYQAEVRASLDGERWSTATAGVAFTVLPPFWRTWWFAALVLGAVAAASYAVYRYRLTQALKLERTRTQIATDLHDEVGAGLSEIALMGEVWARGGGSDAGAGNGVPKRIATLSRRLVDSMSDIVWAINPEKDRLFNLSGRMRRFATSLLRSGGIRLKFHSIDESQDRALDGATRRELLLAFQEIVNNAVKHAGCTTVEARLEVAGGQLLMQVDDDGRGFDPNKAAEGTGLSSLRRRASRLRGECLIGSAPGGGARVTFRVPLERRRSRWPDWLRPGGGPGSNDTTLPDRGGVRRPE